jgi:hypothetical protein
MPKQDPMIRVAAIPAPGGKLTPKKWREVERYLEQWKADVLDAVRKHPAKSFEAGRAQIEAFVNLLGKLGQVSVPPATVGEGPTSREAQWWVERYTFHEIDDALNEYIGKIKDAILYGAKGAMNPVTIASALYKATQDSQVNWRAIARTESVRATAAGRYLAMEQMGYDQCWCPPHAGACKSCRRLIENKVFPIAQLKDATNYGRRQQDWIPCMPATPPLPPRAAARMSPRSSKPRSSTTARWRRPGSPTTTGSTRCSTRPASSTPSTRRPTSRCSRPATSSPTTSSSCTRARSPTPSRSAARAS